MRYTSILLASVVILIAGVRLAIAFADPADWARQWRHATAGSEHEAQTAIETLEYEGKKGDARAAFLMGRIFDKGFNRPVDMKQAREWYQRSGQAGDQEARLQSIRLDLIDAKTYEDVKPAVKKLQTLAGASCVDAQALMGWCYEFGLFGGDATDERRFVVAKWLVRMIDSPPDRRVHIEEYWYMRSELMPGAREVMPPLPAEALRWYLKAAEAPAGGSAWAAFRAARHLAVYRKTDAEAKQAIKLASQCVSTCDPVLLGALALFFNYEGLLLPDSSDSFVKCMERAGDTLQAMADRGDSDACKSTAWLITSYPKYFTFDERNSNPTTTKLSYYQKELAFRMLGAYRGDPTDQLIVAEHLYAGEFVRKDVTAAATWWEKAAGEGNSIAQFRIATCYAKGEGVAKNEATARMWFEKAKAQGLNDASQIPQLD